MGSQSERLLVALGGCVGTALRYWSFEIWHHRPGTFPTTTLVVNSIGAFLLGALVVAIAGHRREREYRAAFGTGVLGGFTTFSAFTVELAEYARAERFGVGFTYAVAMSAIGIASAALGVAAARRFAGVAAR